jgi:hypothetical protein
LNQKSDRIKCPKFSIQGKQFCPERIAIVISARQIFSHISVGLVPRFEFILMFCSIFFLLSLPMDAQVFIVDIIQGSPAITVIYEIFDVSDSARYVPDLISDRLSFSAYFRSGNGIPSFRFFVIRFYMK